MTQSFRAWEVLQPLTETGPREDTLILEDFSLIAGNNATEELERARLRDRVAELPGVRRGVDVWRATKADRKASEHKIRTKSTGAAVVAFELIGIARAPSVLIPIAAMEVLQNTNSPAETGVATAAMIGGWSFALAKTLLSGIDEYPLTVKATGENFPSLIDNCSKALPGLKSTTEKDIGSRRFALARKVGNSLLTHGRRGFTASVFGVTPYIVTAGVKDRPKTEIRKLGAALSFDGGIVAGLVSGGVAEAIVKLAQDNPALAEHIQSDARNPLYLYTAAGGLMVGEWLNCKRKDRKAIKRIELAPAVSNT